MAVRLRSCAARHLDSTVSQVYHKYLSASMPGLSDRGALLSSARGFSVSNAASLRGKQGAIARHCYSTLNVPQMYSAHVDGRRSMAVSTKEVFWNGTKRSLDPTAPSVVPRRPTTPSQRHTAIIDKSLIWRKGPVSKLTVGLNKTGGRNNQGVITVRHRGGGAKRRYRLVDFKRVHPNDPSTIKGTVERIEYDPNRSAFIALLKHTIESTDGAPSSAAPLSYIICPRGITVGSELVASRTCAVDVRPGNTMLLRYIPVGTVVHNIELKPGR